MTLEFERDAQAEEAQQRNFRKFTCPHCGKDFSDIALQFGPYFSQLMEFHVRQHESEYFSHALVSADHLREAFKAALPVMTPQQQGLFDEFDNAMEGLIAGGFWERDDASPVGAIEEPG